jgi:hypothetical protein
MDEINEFSLNAYLNGFRFGGYYLLHYDIKWKYYYLTTNNINEYCSQVIKI